MRTPALRPLVALVILLSLALSPAQGSASHPVVCTGAVEGEAYVILSGVTGAVQPYCTNIASGDNITWVRGDAFTPSVPASGTCFSAHDAGGLGFGERYTVRFAWDADEGRIRVQAWDNEGEQIHWFDADGNVIWERPCSRDTHSTGPDGTIVVPWQTFTRSAVGIINIDIR